MTKFNFQANKYKKKTRKVNGNRGMNKNFNWLNLITWAEQMKNEWNGVEKEKKKSIC